MLPISRPRPRYRQLSAGQLHNRKLRNRFEEWKARAERIPLAGESMNCNVYGGHSEFQPNDFSDWHLVAQHGRDPEFADVDRAATDHGSSARVDTYIHFHLVTGMTSGFHHR